MCKIQIYNEDCFSVMTRIPTGHIKLTVTSPPYDNLRTYNGNTSWNYTKFQSIAKELYRITAEGGVVVWIVSDQTIAGSETGTSFRQALFFKECGFNLHDTMIWKKTKILPRDTRIPRYWQAFEYMFILSKGKPDHFTFLRERTKYSGLQTTAYSRNPDGSLRYDRRDKTVKHIVNDTKPLCNVWEINNPSMKGHPATFPEKLAENHILSWSYKDDTVFDPFMGSGTTGISCIKNNRNFIGTEIDKNYFELAKQRIEQAKMNKETEENTK